MTETATEYSIDSILDLLDRNQQRATYGAVAGVVGRAPRSLMSGRQRTARDSWIVKRETGLPAGYDPDRIHPDIRSRDEVLSSPSDLRDWLADPR